MYEVRLIIFPMPYVFSTLNTKHILKKKYFMHDNSVNTNFVFCNYYNLIL